MDIELLKECMDNKCSHCKKQFENGDFLTDAEKMRDFLKLTKEEFLTSYDYLTENEYDNTRKKYDFTRELVLRQLKCEWDRKVKNGAELYLVMDDYSGEYTLFTDIESLADFMSNLSHYKGCESYEDICDDYHNGLIDADQFMEDYTDLGYYDIYWHVASLPSIPFPFK